MPLIIMTEPNIIKIKNRVSLVLIAFKEKNCDDSHNDHLCSSQFFGLTNAKIVMHLTGQENSE